MSNRNNNKTNRIGEERLNNQGCLMKIVEDNGYADIVVEFQDEYRYRTHAIYGNYLKGEVKNLYHPYVFGIGMIGSKYPSRINSIKTREYKAWVAMLNRCTDEKLKEEEPTYQDVTCCKEWLLYENFYEWLYSQDNFDKWINGDRWALDKDILVKGNKIYSPETCCLVPKNVNNLFLKRESKRGNMPIGVHKNKKWNGYHASCRNPFTNRTEYLGSYSTPERAFQIYKDYKEKLIKQVAQVEFDKGNITKECYDAMMNYKVEITD